MARHTSTHASTSNHSLTLTSRISHHLDNNSLPLQQVARNIQIQWNTRAKLCKLQYDKPNSHVLHIIHLTTSSITTSDQCN